MTQAAPSVFRRQAVEQTSKRLYGTVVLARPWDLWLLTLVFGVLALALVVFFMTFSTTRKTQAQGLLLPGAGVTRIQTAQAGIIVAKYAREGQPVRAGDVLFVLNSERSSGASSATQKTISGLLQRRRDSYGAEVQQSGMQSRQRIAALGHRADELAAEAHKLDEQMALQLQRVTLAEQTVNRYQELQATQFISASQLQDKQAELLDQRQRLAELGRAKAASQRDAATAQADMQDLRIQAQRDAAALMRSASAVEQDLTDSEARREILVRAPQDGVLAAVTGELGQSVASGQPLASLLPAGTELEAEIYVPSRSIGFIKAGTQVLLRYQAYPYQKFGQHAARVREVAVTSLRADELPLPGAALPPGSIAEPLYRIRLSLDRQTVQAYGEAMPLRSGMLLDASILLDQRKLYEWVLEPVFSVSGRM